MYPGPPPKSSLDEPHWHSAGVVFGMGKTRRSLSVQSGSRAQGGLAEDAKKDGIESGVVETA